MRQDMACGRHALKLKAVNVGVYSDPLSLMIDIDHVWYATWWALIGYMLTVAMLAFLVYRHFQTRAAIQHQEEERRNQARILESKLQFFTNISHEIRTPLSLVISPLQKLMNSDKDNERTTLYHTIMRNANRILRLVNEMMDLRKLDNKQMKMRFSEVNLCDFVSDLYETFLPAAKMRKVNLSFTHSGCDDLTAWVDKSNFDKIVMNLISNAVKFTPEDGSVNIRLTKGDDLSTDSPLRQYAEISVTDTGIGISEEDRKHIFNRFFQASNNNAGGTGIGLHLTSQLVELHHGTISISDNPAGKGTCFTVRVPLGKELLSAEELAVHDQADKQAHTPKITNVNYAVDLMSDTPGITRKPAPKKRDLVYIVEDDEEIRRYLEDAFGTFYKTEGFSNGRLALERIHAQCPALVITDVMMPEMDGLTLTRKIKQNINLNHVPVIVLTA
ncbi:MAG: response regulator, partial [Muribaculaceae bacterium]|nr:response regulator [Muribaculaceae bacterium]